MHRVPRPIVMILVYGIFLVIVGLTAVVQTVMVSTHFYAASLNATVGADAALVRLFVTSTLTPADLGPAGLTPERQADMQERLAYLVGPGKILRVEVRLPDGRVLLADQPSLHGSTSPVSPDFAAALAGQSATATIADTPLSEATGPPLETTNVLREYFPLVTDGKVQAVVGVWRDAVPILALLETVRRNIVLVTLSAGLIAAFALYLVFRSAQGRISRQTDALIEATRRDTLTGTLNHGALVEALARAVEEARATNAAIGVALVDIDNFRLLNETHGHDAGDQALLTVVDRSARTPAGGRDFGRYGPDELLVVAPGRDLQHIEEDPERFRCVARRPRPPGRRRGAAAADGQRRRVHLSGPRRGR